MPLRPIISLELFWLPGFHSLFSRLLLLFGLLQSEFSCLSFIFSLMLFFLSWVPLTCLATNTCLSDCPSLLFGTTPTIWLLCLHQEILAWDAHQDDWTWNTFQHWGCIRHLQTRRSLCYYHSSVFGPSLSVLPAWPPIVNKTTKQNKKQKNF